jgi:uncharacterized protein (DUF697 family)/GTP-binding protein EngB required for normal cell division
MDFEDGILKNIQAAQREAREELGHANIIIAGRTGVGKSTLINAVFEGDFAATGHGRPVTQSIKEITKEGIPLTIFDTKGLEMADYKSCFDELEQLIQSRSLKEADPMRHIHAAWLCIHEDGRRVEDAEVDLHNMLANYNIPVVGVITKARSDNGFKSVVEGLLPKARNVARVRALPEELDEGHKLPAMGLKELVELTIGLIPEAVQRAFIAAQKVAVQRKIDLANKFMAAAAAAAATAGITPIPFSDAAIIVPIQVGMLAKISTVFGLQVGNDLLKSLLFTLVGTTAATVAGRAIVTNLLKFVPGIGSAVGGAISGATAAGLTTTLGKMYISTMAKVCGEAGGNAPTADEIAQEFKKQLSIGKSE